jgi:hypothetical protein
MNSRRRSRVRRSRPGGGPAGPVLATAAALACTIGGAGGSAAALAAAPRSGADCSHLSWSGLAVDAARATTTTADLDGDGVREWVGLTPQAYGTGERWLLAAFVADGVVIGEIQDPGPTSSLRLTGRADVDGDGDEEVVISSPMGAYTDVVQVWGVRGCAWSPVTIGDDPSPAEFIVGASVIHGTGVRCAYRPTPTLETFSSERIDYGATHRVEVRAYAWSDLHLTAVGPPTTLVVTDDELSARWSASFACGQATSAHDAVPAPSAWSAPTAAGTGAEHSSGQPTTHPSPTAVQAQPHFTG